MEQPQITVTSDWHQAYPGAHIGLLLVGGVDNSKRRTPLDVHKQDLEQQLRQRFQGWDRAALLELPELSAYHTYYRRFGNTYHVQLQLELVIFSGKSLASISPLVDACFASELETLILTASHDADKLVPPVEIDIARGDEQLIQLSGAEKTVKARDMLMRDAQSTVCTVTYGPDRRTAITPGTTRALYVSYVPPGIPVESVYAHLEKINDNVLRFAPGAEVGLLRVHTAGV